MIKRLLLLAMLSVALSGCFMGPLALIGPVTSGFSTASLLKSGASATANYLVKKTTGKAISQHAFDALTDNTVVQTYFPKNEVHALTSSESKTFQIHKN